MIHDGKTIIAVFLDLQRAFETLDRNILLNKLQCYGLKDVELKWFKSYLNGRKQKTKVNNVFSDNINIKIGVPQGSVLGALLFLSYINDIHGVVNFSELVLFADDTLMFVVGNNVKECLEKINGDLDTIEEWLKMNKLKLNVNKTKCMVWNGSLNENENVIVNNNKIELVEEIKYLGVIIDNKVNFKKHLDYIM